FLPVFVGHSNSGTMHTKVNVAGRLPVCGDRDRFILAEPFRFALVSRDVLDKALCAADVQNIGKALGCGLQREGLWLWRGASWLLRTLARFVYNHFTTYFVCAPLSPPSVTASMDGFGL